MNSLPEALARADLHRIQQAVKWLVYSLLLVNFGFYIYEDWDSAIHTLPESATLLDWAKEFATSIDELAWFGLLFMFELETYALEDERWEGWVGHAVRGIRVACFLMIAHTVFAYADTVADYSETRPVADATSLCDLADRDVAFVYNLDYTAVDSGNCRYLSTATQYYQLGPHPLVTTADGLELERDLAWADLAEAVIWLLVILSMEIVVRLQGRGVTGGAALAIVHTSKLVLYLALAGLAIYWASLSHWLYAWDEFLWIAGFAAIEMNVHEWRDEMLSAAGDA